MAEHQGTKTAAGKKDQPDHARTIQLHVDLEVDPEKEEALVSHFHRAFMPAMSRQRGFVEVKLMKLRKVMKGNATNATHRLLISFLTEGDRLAWVASDDHQRAWPGIAGNLKGPTVSALLYDVA